ncbi:DUF3857 domain-containing protein [Pedobacter metabolipauper]|uniref:Uncharacterized protein DUF3858 n=1 Tax=Pedobacter metabolipauper TaxID=425513 RepID=A0A4R6T131_9SPHI|nr:DUF3857 domain-containing protein [Pedobacter metabolipauper]TDQ12095.1 uncharacterized protein DUF3858 [Pedobacter metabolipauper]
MKPIILLVFALFFSIPILNAQDFEYGQISNDDVILKNTRLDSNANAMVIREFGTARMRLDDASGRLFVDFQYHVRLKIFNKNGFEHGTITIPLRIRKEEDDRLVDLKATTINYADGNLTRTDLDRKKFYVEKLNKYTSLTKFTMPDLKDGSIIEYSYTIQSPYIFNFRRWEFQSDIPKMHSEYIAFIPAYYNYHTSLRGALKFTTENAEINNGCLNINGVMVNCSKMSYIIKNVPAFIEEDNMTAPSNFKSSINYELSDYMLTNGTKFNVTKSWKDVDRELLADHDFGQQMKKKEVFLPLLPQILKNTTDELSKAKAIYSYIEKNIKSNGFIGYSSENTIKKANELHSGNTGDINLALMAALSAAGLDAEAVILSTRANGAVGELYPVLSDFNYVVVKVNIAGQSYLLDASEPYLPFGLLPLECINGKGRVFSLTKPSYWHDLTANQKRSTRTILTGTLSPDGKMKGTLSTYSLGYAAVDKRERISRSTSVDDFVEKLDEQMPNIKITSHKIENLDSINNMLIETYEIETQGFDVSNPDQIFYNPFFINRTSTNPFNLNERTYPVDLGSAREDRIIMNIKMPENFILADKPKDIGIALPNAAGRYMAAIALDNSTLSVSQTLQLNKPIYEPDEYLSLKEFYSRIIQSQKTDILFKTK